MNIQQAWTRSLKTSDSPANLFIRLAMLMGPIFLLIAGPGRWSVDSWLDKRTHKTEG